MPIARPLLQYYRLKIGQCFTELFKNKTGTFCGPRCILLFTHIPSPLYYYRILIFNPKTGDDILSSCGGMEGCVDTGGWRYAEIVYPPADSHPSRQRRATSLINTSVLSITHWHTSTTLSGVR